MLSIVKWIDAVKKSDSSYISVEKFYFSYAEGFQRHEYFDELSDILLKDGFTKEEKPISLGYPQNQNKWYNATVGITICSRPCEPRSKSLDTEFHFFSSDS